MTKAEALAVKAGDRVVILENLMRLDWTFEATATEDAHECYVCHGVSPTMGANLGLEIEFESPQFPGRLIHATALWFRPTGQWAVVWAEIPFSFHADLLVESLGGINFVQHIEEEPSYDQN